MDEADSNSGGAWRRAWERTIEIEHRGNEVGRNLLNRVVVGEDRVVVDLPADRDLVLGLLEILLETGEVVRCPQLGVVLGHRKESECLGEGNSQPVPARPAPVRPRLHPAPE